MLPEIVYLTQLDTGTRIALPLTPEKVSDKREGNFISYNILNVGEVKIPNGEKLAQFSWNGILPGVSMLGMGIVSLFDWKPPRVMIGILDGWKKNRKKLQKRYPQDTPPCPPDRRPCPRAYPFRDYAHRRE